MYRRRIAVSRPTHSGRVPFSAGRALWLRFARYRRCLSSGSRGPMRGRLRSNSLQTTPISDAGAARPNILEWGFGLGIGLAYLYNRLLPENRNHAKEDEKSEAKDCVLAFVLSRNAEDNVGDQ